MVLFTSWRSRSEFLMGAGFPVWEEAPACLLKGTSLTNRTDFLLHTAKETVRPQGLTQPALGPSLPATPCMPTSCLLWAR